MEIVILILLIGLLIFGFCMYRKNYEEGFVEGSYVIQWEKPSSTGGDTGCCSYDWRICELEDKDCSKPVDSGSVKAGSALQATTSKVDWGNTYNVMVRANNKYGPGAWSSVQLVAGGGTLESVVIGNQIDSTGKITTPLAAGSNQVMVWANISAAESKGAGELNAELFYEQIRDNKTVSTSRGTTTSKAGPNGQDVFTATFTGVTDLRDGDVVKIYIYVTSGGGLFTPFTDGVGSTTISGSIPGSVGKITMTYRPLGYQVSQPIQIDCEGILNQIESAGAGADGSVQKLSAAAFNQTGGDNFKFCTPYEKGKVLMYAYAAPPNDPTRTCDQAVSLVAGSLENDAMKCGAYGALASSYLVSPGYSSACYVNNPTVVSWGLSCAKL